MASLPFPRARGGRRWRDHGLLAGLSPRARGLAGGGAPRAQAAHLRLDLACRRPGRPAAQQRQRHPAAQALGRALRPARGRDRPGERLEDERRPQARLHRGAHDRSRAPGDDGPQLRPRDEPPHARRGQGSVAADGRFRSGRRRVPADRRPGQSRGHRAGPGQGGAPGRRPDRRGLPRHRLSHRRWMRGRRAHRAGRDRLRGGGAVRRPVVDGARPSCRRARAARPGAAPVHDHRADRGRGARSADAARPRPADLLQGGGRRAGDGRLRAGPQAVG